MFNHFIFRWIFFLLPFVCAFLAYRLAKRRNREAILWSILCFIFPPLIIILLCLGVLQQADK